MLVCMLPPDVNDCNHVYTNSVSGSYAINGFNVSVKKVESVPDNKVALGLEMRKALGVNIDDPVFLQKVNFVPSKRVELSVTTLNVCTLEMSEDDAQKIVKSLKVPMTETQVFYSKFQNRMITFRVLVAEPKGGVVDEKTEIVVTKDLTSHNKRFTFTPSKTKGSTCVKIPLNPIEIGIGGIGDAYNKIVDALKTRLLPVDLVERLGIVHVRGILLYGPPGTGKTLIARRFRDVLGAKSFQVINGPQLLSKWIGESESNVRKLFEEAQKDQEDENNGKGQSGLHMIVFDEIDALFKKRSGDSGEKVSVTNQMLTLLDGVDRLNNLIVIGITNRKDILDPAILRTGRLGLHIEIPKPTVQGREEILKIHTKRMQENDMLDKVNFRSLAEVCDGFSGSDIEAWVTRAIAKATTALFKIDEHNNLVVKNDNNNIKVTERDFTETMHI